MLNSHWLESGADHLRSASLKRTSIRKGTRAMNDNKRAPLCMMVIFLMLLLTILAFQGVMIAKLYADRHPESRLVKITERIDKLEDSIEAKVRKIENRNDPKRLSVTGKQSQGSEDVKPEEPESDIPSLEDWNPFQEMRLMREQVDEMFGHSLERFRNGGGFDESWLKGPYVPATDFEAKEDRYLVSMDIPGIKKSDLEVSLEGLLLRIKGQREELIEHKEDGKVLRTERLHGQFLRAFTMPGGIDPEKSTAEYKDGVLTVIIPKGAKTDVTRKIEVK
jgi:HSP20 family protein